MRLAGRLARRRALILALVAASALGIMLLTGAASASPVLASSGKPQAMEGDLKLAPGSTLKAGFDFTMPGAHPQATVVFASSTVLFMAKCTSGTASYPVVVPLPDTYTPVAANDSAWHPTGSQSSPDSYQASISVPDLCGGGLVSLKLGGTFQSLVSSTDTNDKVNFRWHYSGGGSAGGWSGTYSVVPGSLVGAQLAISPTATDFGGVPVGGSSAAATFTVENTGGLPSGALASALSDASFALVSDGCAGTILMPGSTCAILVNFKPTASGPAAGTVKVSGSPGGTATATVSGSGLAPGRLSVAPASQDFNDVTVGASSPVAVFTVTNTGEQPTGAIASSVTGAGFTSTSDTCAGASLAAGATCTIKVAFAPTAAGAATGGLQVGAIPGGTAGAALTGVGVAPAHIELTPSTNDFGRVGVGSSAAPQTFTLTNTGGRETGRLADDLSGDGFWIGTDGCADVSLTPGSTCTIDVAFTPTIAGAANGTLEVTASPGGTASASLNGTGLAPGKLAISPIGNDFGSVGVGESADIATFVVSNIGDQSAGSLSSAVDGDGFAISDDTCDGADLGSGSSCLVQVHFQPTTAGAASGSLQLTASPGGTVSADLSGEGLAPAHVEIAPASNDFGSVPVGGSSAGSTFTIANSGGQPTGPLDIALSGAGFVMTSDGCGGSSLAAGSTCQVDVSFAPDTSGSATGSLTVNSSQGGSASADLAGNGLAPGSLSIAPDSHEYGTVVVGNSAGAASFTVTNTGGQPTGTTSTAITGAGFVVTSDSCAGGILSPGANCTIEVGFTPSEPGAVSGGLQISGTPGGTAGATLNGTGIAPAHLDVAPASFDFGATALGSTSAAATFTFTNSGGAATGFLSTSLEGAGFAITSDGCAAGTLSPGSSCAVEVSFAPDTVADVNGKVTVTGSPGGAAESALTASGVAPGKLEISPVSHDFAAVKVGETSGAVTFTVTNTGGTATGALTASITGSEFALSADTCTGATLAGGASCTLDATFAPTAVGPASASIEVGEPGGAATAGLSGMGEGTEPPPPPAEVDAPPLIDTGITPFSGATDFLYTGAEAIQKDADPAKIDTQRVVVLRGSVMKIDETPLGGVRVSVPAHPELGYTLTRADGEFYLAGNGGGVVTVRLEKEGYLPAERTLDTTPWGDYAFLHDPVALVQLDAKATSIDLSGPDGPSQVAQGSIESDADGQRQATLIFPAGTEATMVMPDGSTQPLPHLTVRATEYTVGENGQRAMPADLPASSAYTYAVEFSADEATAAGAKQVRFSKPVVSYTQNFIGLPVGEAVPAGTYDEDAGAWKPIHDGRVVKILSVEGGHAVLDVTGDGNPASAAELAALGVTDDELKHLGDLYSSGDTLWRVPVEHFSSFDWNCALFGLALELKFLKSLLPGGGDPHTDHPCKSPGSIIECENQTLGEEIAVVGTPFTLRYQSDRVPGRTAANSIEIPISESPVPPEIKSIDVHLDIAGRRFDWHRDPLPNQRITFVWDGKDVYGRTPYGPQRFSVRVDYTYPGVFYAKAGGIEDTEGFKASFAQLPKGFFVSGLRRRAAETVVSQEATGSLQGTTVGPWDARTQGFGGWTLDAQNAYDSATRTLQLGDGNTKFASGLRAGVGVQRIAGSGTGTSSGDGGPAVAARFNDVRTVAVAPDGSAYVVDSAGGRVRRIAPNRAISTVAGTTPAGQGEGPGDSPAGDGGPATSAQLWYPEDVAIAPDTSLVIADSYHHRIRKVSPQGIIVTVAGGGDGGPKGCDHIGGGDGGPATEAALCYPESVAVASDGALYVDDGQRLIRRVAPDGTIATVAGAGTKTADGALAIDTAINDLTDIAVAPDGSIYYAERERRVRRISADGIVTTVAGTADGSGLDEDGIPATQAAIGPTQIAFAADGSLLIADLRFVKLGLEGNDRRTVGRIRRVDAGGTISTIIGSGDLSPTAGQARQLTDAGSAKATAIDKPFGLAVAPDGSILVSDVASGALYEAASPLPGPSASGIRIASDDGAEVYEFDTFGRQLRTLDALTGAVIYEFHYDSSGRLTSIVDGDGGTTRIERDGSGAPTAIVAPFGQRTALTTNAAGYLAKVVDPAGAATDLAYGGGGLLSSLTDGRRNTSTFEYNSLGLLESDQNASGGRTALTRGSDASGFGVDVTTKLGRVTTLHVGPGTTRTRKTPDGLVATFTTDSADTQTLSLPDGVTVKATPSADPRFGTQSTFAGLLSATQDNGPSLTISHTESAVLANPTDPFSLTSLTDKFTMGGATNTSVFNAALKMFTHTSPAGRTSTLTVDKFRRPLNVSVTGVTPVNVGYEEHGLLTSVGQGTRKWQGTYDSQGLLATSADALGESDQFGYDADGRVTHATSAGGAEVSLMYDESGNTTSVTPPGQPATTFAYTPTGALETASSPDAGDGVAKTTYGYDDDGFLRSIVQPDGTRSDLAYTAAGRVASVLAGDETHTYTYSPATGLPKAITSSAGTNLSFGFAGATNTSQTMTGPVAGTVGWTYDTQLRVASSEAAGSKVTYGYDADGLLTSVGALTLSRSAANRQLKGLTIGTASTTLSYDSAGSLVGENTTSGGQPLLSFTYTYDKLGRVATRKEVAQGATHLFAYQYDADGRLTRVDEDGSVVNSYTYDRNGNRLTTSGGSQFVASYDARDRLVTSGAASFAYGLNGELLRVSDGAAATGYSYDGFGHLAHVDLPDGRKVDYVYDPLGRRVGIKIDGTLQVGFLYGEAAEPLAETNPDGTLRARFVYGSTSHVPNYMVATGHTYRLVTDERGSVRVVVDTASGAVAERLEYDPWGRITQDTNPGFQPFGFAGGLVDGATSLVHFGSRDYDPTTGRFTTADPLGFAGGDTNLYAYAHDDPVNFIDPVGLWDLSISDWVDSHTTQIASFSGGVGDVMLFGYGDKLRSWTDHEFGWHGEDVVDKCSGWYTAGEWTGIAITTFAGGRGGWVLAAKNGRTYYVFSHWVPARYLKLTRIPWVINVFGKSRFNGNYVDELVHAMTDPHAWQFLPPSVKAQLVEQYTLIVRQWKRLPYTVTHATSGATYASGGAALSACDC
jgi:RHS repeat-associated protein